MRRLRVLTFLCAIACGSPEPAPTPAPAPAPEAAPAPAEAPAPKVQPLKVGETLDVTGTFGRVWPEPGDVALGVADQPTVLFFWSPSSSLSRDELVRFDRWVAESGLAGEAQVLAVAGTKEDGIGAEDVRDMAVLLDVGPLQMVTDPDYALAKRLGVQQLPEMVVIGSDRKVLARGLQSVEHARLSSPGRPGQMTAKEYLLAVAAEKTGPSLPRTMPYSPGDAMIGHQLPDATLTRFSADASKKGEEVRLRSLLSGKRPAAVFFFSSTCKHCQVDVPQIVKLVKEHPGEWDVIGVTSIKSPQHREITARYLEQQGVTFPVLEDGGALSDLMRVNSTPTTFYAAANGTIGAASYYQHRDLADDWTRLAKGTLATLPKGEPLPEATGWDFPLVVSDEAGAEVDLASFEGKPTILHFWATWCAPCREELPKLLARMPELEETARVALISVEKDPRALDRYRAQTGLDLRSYLAPRGGVADKLDLSRSVPRTYVVDAHGQLVQVLRGSYAWDDDEKVARVIDRLR